MIHKTPQKELEYVLGVVKRVQNCVDLQNNFNHDAMDYLSDLIEISKNYAIMLHETVNPMREIPLSGKQEGNIMTFPVPEVCDVCGRQL
ncbi:MAG TPA: hypothetical protein PL124_13115 [Candidatus Cloacimonadota bacterium]|nr:hypothetical protein [Candidatus Cloacimonadota bacterium]